MLQGKTIRIIFASPSHKEDGRYVIGKDGDIPWKGLVHSDMVRFRKLTTKRKENSVIMGRKTWDSLDPKFKPLSNRQNIVLTRNKDFKTDNPDVVVAHSLKEAVKLATSKTVWIIGGAEIYALALKVADFLHHTIVFGRYRGDTFFPHFNKKLWEMESWKDFRRERTGTKKDKIDSGYMVFKRK